MSTEATTEATTMSTEATTGTTTERHWTDPLQHIACTKGIKDGRQYDTFADWWHGTQRSDYMLWLLEAVAYPDDRELRLLACRFIRETRIDDTRTVWGLLTDDRSRSAVEVAERYAVGEATDEELKAAEKAAGEAADRVAVRTTASAAAWCAASTAKSNAISAACATNCTTVSAAVWGAGRAWTVAWMPALARQANIIREMIPATEIAPLFERYIQNHG